MADLVFMTSGTTGEAQRVIRTDAQLQADAQTLVAAFPGVWRGARSVVASIREDHLYGALWRVRAPAVAGVPVLPGVVLSVEDLLSIGVQHRPFAFMTTPSFLAKAVEHPDFPNLKGAFSSVITSGGPLPETIARHVAEMTGVCPTEIFGSTETGTVASRRVIETDLWTVVNGVSVACGEEGRLIVHSPFAMDSVSAMSDRVEMVDARHFRLLGRVDRRVKILERFVSLSAVERALAASPLVQAVRVEPSLDAVPRLGALLVLSDEGREKACAGTFAEVTSAIRACVRGTLESFAVPRRYRFVRVLPVDERGKTTAAAVRAALGAWCREPVVLSWQATDERLDADFVFPPDMECFCGHFPGFPILPGVATLHFLRHFARQAFPDFPKTPTYRKLKFQKIVLPSKVLHLTLLRKEADRFDFSFVGASGPAAIGSVEETV